MTDTSWSNGRQLEYIRTVLEGDKQIYYYNEYGTASSFLELEQPPDTLVEEECATGAEHEDADAENTEASDVEMMKLLGLPTGFGDNTTQHASPSEHGKEHARKRRRTNFSSETSVVVDTDSCCTRVHTRFDDDEHVDDDNGTDDDMIAALPVTDAYKEVYRGVSKDVTMAKYWRKRYWLFSKFDEGICIDRESFYSVTPQAIAECIASYFADALQTSDAVIVDGFCGCALAICYAMCNIGGNAIQLAMHFDRVIAIDIDQRKIDCAKQNAAIYEVEDKIDFICGDFVSALPTLPRVDAFFLSPPWGGPQYVNAKSFEIAVMDRLICGADSLFELARAHCKNIAYFLPRNTPPEEIALLLPDGGETTVVCHYALKKSKRKRSNHNSIVAITALFGQLAVDAVNS